MTRRRKSPGGDPRRHHSAGIAGPGGPHDRNAVIIDAENAILPRSIVTAMVEPDPGSGQEPLAALTIGGRVNKSSDEVTLLYIMSVEGAAQLAASIAGVFQRYGPVISARFLHAFDQELAAATAPPEPE